MKAIGRRTRLLREEATPRRYCRRLVKQNTSVSNQMFETAVPHERTGLHLARAGARAKELEIKYLEKFISTS